jgi:hypothetical protein
VKKFAAIAFAALIAIGAAGCSDGSSAQVEEAPATVAATSAPTEVTPAPVTSTPEAPPEEGGFGMGDYTPDEFFIANMDRYWQGDARPDDEALIGAGKLVCEQLTAGTAKDAVVAVEGDAHNNDRVIQAATQAYCPDFF